MIECQVSDHNKEEILYACLNMNCQIKRGCCLYCIEQHNLHKQDLKSMKQITLWKKNITQSYDTYSKKISQIMEIIGQAQQYLSNLGQDLEKQFDQIMNDEFEKQVFNLLRIQQLSTSFNQLISNLETLMEPISQIFSNVEASSQNICVKIQSILNNSNDKLQIMEKESQTEEVKKGEPKVEPKKQKVKTYSYLNIIENTYKLRKGNDFDIHQYPKQCKSSIENLDEYKTIILIGTQSSEKQNLINLFVNYYYGVEFQDPYRFEIIDDIDIKKEKQNDEYEKMKVYYITPQNGKSGLRIIYTPDYSDDLNYDDQQICTSIYNVISNSAQLNQNILIGFLIPRKVQIGSFFMLESILSQLSNKLIKNIVFLFPDSTDESPKQKEILQSKTQKINGIQSPVFQMIPTMNHFWYLKFNTNTLFNQNKNQDNQYLWELGKNNFQLLLQNYLQNKINLNSLQQMKQQYDQFINIKLTGVQQQLKNKYYELYRRDNFDCNFKIIFERFKKEIIPFISNHHIDKTKSEGISTLKHYKGIMDNQYKEIEKFKSLDQKIYNKDFEEFYDLLKNFWNLMQQEYYPWSVYFKFNSILISINNCQWRYYQHLITKEQIQKQEGWEERVNLLTKKKIQYYSDGYVGMPNLDQIVKEWYDKNIRSKWRYVEYSSMTYKEYDKVYQICDYDKISVSEIFYRIDQGSQKEIDILIQKIWDSVLI
ncbi:unnamed protein product [Paramecium pentaurelia]|uniref:Uncharacterized protein n=1 Tax=Paramecium pentaurelia TaxID=43138 RepID=A0A8S1TFJ3_9CILI|nr:unnamed protein product [Paramecium pentaurelia]